MFIKFLIRFSVYCFAAAAILFSFCYILFAIHFKGNCGGWGVMGPISGSPIRVCSFGEFLLSDCLRSAALSSYLAVVMFWPVAISAGILIAAVSFIQVKRSQ